MTNPFHGSGDLIRTLLKNDLVDEPRMKTFPVTIGAGRRLFGEGTFPAGFKLVKKGGLDRGSHNRRLRARR